MNLLESFKSAIRSIKANKMRSILTMLGIIIGIGSVIMITSIGSGSQNQIAGEFNKIGANVLTVSMKDYVGAEPRDFLEYNDIDVLKANSEVVNVSPIVVMGGTKVNLRNPRETRYAQIVGVNEDYRYIQQLELKYGRFISEMDNKAKSEAVLIYDSLASQIFGNEDAVGQKITLKTRTSGTYRCTIIGIIKNPMAAFESMLGENFPTTIIMPAKTVSQIYKAKHVDQIIVSVKDMQKINDTAAVITKMLEIKHRNTDKYAVQTALKSLEQINKVLGTITAFVSFVAGISLLVGGVGVMNIMLVTVTERTREIGIRKSLGAKDKDILLQFLIEAVIITIIGGIIGMLLGFLGGAGIGSLIKIAPKISGFAVVITVVISSLVGIVFGVYPASRAAKLDPIEALRYE